MKQLTAGHPDAAEDAVAQAESLIALGRYELALASIGRGLIIAPTDSRLHCQRALARQRLGRFRDASRSAGEAISSDPHEAWAYELKAAALSAQARTRLPPWRQQLGRQARDAARRAVKLAPEDAQCRCTAAEAELLAGDWPAARDAAQKALELAPDSPEPFAAVAAVALAARDFATARDAARRALALDPTNYDATNHLGSALAGLGRWTRAAATYAAAARLDPEAQPARRNLVRLGVAIVVPAVVSVLLLLLLAPYGAALFPLACMTAGTAIALSTRLRRRLGRVGLVVALGLARLDGGGGALAAGALATGGMAAMAALTVVFGAAVAGQALVAATIPVALGFGVVRGAGPVRGRVGRPSLGGGAVAFAGLRPRRRRPLAGASTALLAVAGGVGWLVTAILLSPYLRSGAAGGRPGGPLVGLIPAVIALTLTGVLVRRRMGGDRG